MTTGTSNGYRVGERRRASLRGAAAFTVIDLLVCVGIITILVSTLLPTVAAARSGARLLTCATNVRNICQALQEYAGLNEGKYPPNVSAPAPGQFWCDRKRVGDSLGHRTPQTASSLGGGALACPEDEGGQRSYAMNVWASSAVDGFIRSASVGRGAFWSYTSGGDTSRLILVAEAWSGHGSDDWFTAKETIGFAGDKPGQRFGGGVGIAPPVSAGRFGPVTSELPFARHRDAGGKGKGVEPKGRVQIGYADGHVSLLRESELVGLDGKSSLQSLWTPVDRLLER
jgi:prepilin-type processing-associated H-X9-DG protein